MGSKAEKKARQAATSAPKRDFSYTQNRELSWLRFDERVLDEANDASVPLFERLKFAAIFESNLDEFLMVRVGGLSDLAELKHQPRDNKSNLTPAEQVDEVFSRLPGMLDRWGSIFSGLEDELASYGVSRARVDELSPADRTFVNRYFQAYVSPIISPLVIDPRHPFPNLRNGALYLVCALEGADDEESLLGLIEIPSSMNRTVEIPSPDGEYRYILLEDVILTCLDSCFGSYRPLDRALIRVTRNADIDPDGEGVAEDDDYRLHMKKVLKKRLRLKPVALAVSGDLERRTLKTIRRALGLSAKNVLACSIPLDLGFVFGIEGKIPEAAKKELLFEPFRPQANPTVKSGVSLRQQVLEGDKLLFYPYESMSPFLDLVHEAAHDDDCISIRITLYRVAKQSRLCESLIDAAELGREVTVLMELRARFDEQNNIEWAERLEEAGCTVIYGSEGFKCHSKICQITYREGMALTRLTLLGTGNFNEKTAKLYSDFMLMTAHPGIGEDANLFFRNLTLGNLKGDYRFLGVAPTGLKPLIMRGLDREISRALAGEPARVFFKLNSLTDREVIDKISEASRAGVTVDMIIRGISCLRPGVAGKTDNVHVRSIVGRFLEHARVYAFGIDSDMVYLSSADMMTRNTEHRVEIAYPVLDPTCRALVREFMQVQLADNVKARMLTSEGTWAAVPRAAGEKPFNSQEFLLARAYANAGNERATAHVDAVAAPKPTVVEESTAEAPAASGPVEVASAQTVIADPAQASEPVSEPVVPASQPEQVPAPAPAVEAAPAKEPEAVPMQATIVEPEPEAEAEPAAAREQGGRASAAKDAAEPIGKHARRTEKKECRSRKKTLAKREPGRMRLGLGLIGLGIKTLVTGKVPGNK